MDHTDGMTIAEFLRAAYNNTRVRLVGVLVIVAVIAGIGIFAPGSSGQHTTNGRVSAAQGQQHRAHHPVTLDSRQMARTPACKPLSDRLGLDGMTYSRDLAPAGSTSCHATTQAHWTVMLYLQHNPDMKSFIKTARGYATDSADFGCVPNGLRYPYYHTSGIAGIPYWTECNLDTKKNPSTAGVLYTFVNQAGNYGIAMISWPASASTSGSWNSTLGSFVGAETLRHVKLGA